MNNLIWFLTDTDFAQEWRKGTIFSKIKLCYVTGGLLFFEGLNILIALDFIGKMFS